MPSNTTAVNKQKSIEINFSTNNGRYLLKSFRQFYHNKLQQQTLIFVILFLIYLYNFAKQTSLSIIANIW